MLFKTLSTRIAVLDDALVVLPGHYRQWSELNEENECAASMAANP